MNQLAEKLLPPVSAELPCGADLSYDPALDELVTLLKGKPEVEIGEVMKPAEPPDWRTITKKGGEFLEKSKHLQVAVMLCCGLLKTDGFAGVASGLGLLRAWLEQYWPNLYPLLDPEDNNDPTQRLNILGMLTQPRGTLRPDIQQWLAIVDYLYTTPLWPDAPLSFDDVTAARKKEAGGEGGPAEAPDMTKVSAMIRSASAEQLAAQQAALQEALAAAEGIDQFLTITLGAGNSISFDELKKTLTEISSGLQSFTAGASPGGEAADSTGAVAAGAPGVSAPSAISVSGSIRSRDDVVRALDAICDFYRQIEPSSPVPYILRRAQKLATMNFVEACQELNIASTDSLKPSMGSSVESEQSES